MNIIERLNKGTLFFDGGMGTMLQAAGLGAGEIPEYWVLDHPEVIKGIHKAYLEAGCDVMTTCTFGANSFRLHGDKYSTGEIVQAAIRLAREAIEESGREAFVALDTGTTGKLMEPLGDLTFEDAVASYSELFAAGADDADLIIIETQTDLHEMKAAVLAARETTDLPIFATAIVDESGKMMTGGDAGALVALLEGLGVDALGLNCGFGPDKMLPCLKKIQEYASLPVIFTPNAGLPHTRDGEVYYDLDPQKFADEIEKCRDVGPSVIGGCCGTTPDHMAEVIRRMSDYSPRVRDHEQTLVSSYTHAVEIGNPSTIIGEKINPTGNKALAAALRSQDMDSIKELAIREKDAGAQILDINVGLPDIDEPDMLPRVIQAVQEVVDLPLVIDCSNVEAIEKAARIYNGKPIINSVNASRESMDAIFPIVKKYGGAVISLTLGDGGIPKTPEGRLEMAKIIVDEAAKYGIRRKDIIVDCLAMTISADSSSALTTLKAIELVRSELAVNTTLGVSNISFGLPQRTKINTAFYAMALERGLTSAIIDPFSAPMMETALAGRALTMQDENCSHYIAGFENAAPEKPQRTPPLRSREKPAAAAPEKAADGVSGLSEAIINGLKDAAAARAKELLENTAPLDVINEHVIPALTKVGNQFESGESFLPQLVMSAEAATLAFEEIKKKLPASEGGSKGKIILATVKGDIHDIGKNIVKVLLESYGYEVMDLGKDVPPEEIVKAAKENDIRMIGLSALMTTSVPSMEDTIRQLKAELPDCTICVGGAVMTEAFADAIGADHYCDDAMSTVRQAEHFYG
ncbi:MAG: homocysteine S-methyltransferase family protein [Anaerovoracaceae bacterium]|jgi:5-methyltetrahydrofolate--homocysteine methyltransferase